MSGYHWLMRRTPVQARCAVARANETVAPAKAGTCPTQVAIRRPRLPPGRQWRTAWCWSCRQLLAQVRLGIHHLPLAREVEQHADVGNDQEGVDRQVHRERDA